MSSFFGFLNKMLRKYEINFIFPQKLEVLMSSFDPTLDTRDIVSKLEILLTYSIAIDLKKKFLY
jgi:hypothetical protein